MRYLSITCILLLSCCIRPGSLKKLQKAGVASQRHNTSFTLPGTSGQNGNITVYYLGCGGLYLLKEGEGIFIDPFFSNQSVGKIGRSVLFDKKTIASNPKMIEQGWKTIEEGTGPLQDQVIALFSAHSHYDHLMDIPAVFDKLQRKPYVYLNQSGYNTCYSVIDTSRMVILEHYRTTQDTVQRPIELRVKEGKIRIYPIQASHNAHVKHIKFFSGSINRPNHTFTQPFQKTLANAWLEGNTFSFLIDYIDDRDEIALRLFVQSSSCQPPTGIPPSLLRHRRVDLAFLGVASYQFSPDYPCALLEAMEPREVIWIHWEDFFRSYAKSPRTVRGTDVPGFFHSPCVAAYRPRVHLPWPRVRMDIHY